MGAFLPITYSAVCAGYLNNFACAFGRQTTADNILFVWLILMIAFGAAPSFFRKVERGGHISSAAQLALDQLRAFIDIARKPLRAKLPG
jgi:hypothetical protein